MNIILICFKIFFVRIIDVSIGVLRTIMLVKRNTLTAVILAFFEVLIWFIVAKEALTINDSNFLIAIFYSLGYSFGTYIGSILSNILINSKLSVFVISSNILLKDINKIKKEGYGISSFKLDGKNKKMFIIQINNNKLNNLLSIINKLDNKAFITVSDIKYAYNGYIK